MSTLQGVLVPLERDARNIGGSPPRRVYLGDEGTAGHYVFVTLSGEATAWLKETAADEYFFDDNPLEDDGIPYLVSTSPNTILI